MIVKTLDAAKLNLAAFIDADLIRTNEAFARLLSFYSDASRASDVFACDGGTYSALRRAAARIVGAERDKFTEVAWSRKAGEKAWKRVAKNATVPTNHEQKTTTVRSYSSDTVRESIATLRESHGVAIKRQAERTTIDGTEYLVVALVRENVPTVVVS
ncbi:MAG: hypothetical protein ACREA9_02580 [Pyrinomonadaceae bacterium]